MKKYYTTLGLDIGTTSIGWAYIKVHKDNPSDFTILRAGVKIIPLSTNENDAYIKGQRQTKNAKRRLKRSMRRNLHHYKLRRAKLLKILDEHNMLPDAKLLTHSDKYELYGLRVKALSEKVSLAELGRIFYHLNQKRGFHQSRLADEQAGNAEVNSDTNEESFVEGIERRTQELLQANKTPGQAIYEALRKDPLYRVKSNENVKTIYDRRVYIYEFNRIWDKQKEYYRDILTDELKTLLRDKAIYYQRRLKSQKKLVSKCRFEPRFRVTPRSSPFHQVRRMYQDINHLKIKDKNRVECVIEPSMRKLLFEELLSRGELKSKDILALTGFKSYKGAQVNLPPTDSGKERKSLKGFITRDKIKDVLSETGVENPEKYLAFDWEKYIPPIDENCTNDPIKEPLYALWHHLYSFDDTNYKLIDSLIRKYGFTAEQAKALTRIQFKKEYASLSAKATRKILPYLIQGDVFSTACEKAGYRHSDSESKEEAEARELLCQLPNLKRNALRNPAVERILNHLINLINSILIDKDLGRPDAIHVELARELKMNASKREEIFDNNNKREKEKKKITEILSKYIPNPSDQDVLKYRLWKEFGERDPYQPSNVISLTELLSGNYDVDHIIPQSRLFDDSYMNKVVTHRSYNLAKGNMTAFEYMQSRSQKDLEDFLQFIKETKTIEKPKFDRLMMTEKTIPKNFIQRQLRETQYISRVSLKLLRDVCKDVVATSGSITDYLRTRWGLNNVLKQLVKEKYEALGRYKEEKLEDGKRKDIIEGWSKRDDHRHHALDAIVIAATTKSVINSLNLLNQEYESYKKLKYGAPYFGPFWKEMRRKEIRINQEGEEIFSPAEKEVKNLLRVRTREALASVLVSFKSGKRVAVKNVNKHQTSQGIEKKIELTPRGFLHKESIYGKIKVRDRMKLTTKFNLDDLDRITKPRIRTLIVERLALFNNDPKIAFKALVKNPIWYDEKNGIPLEFVPVWREQPVIRKTLGISFTQVDKIVDDGVRRIVIKRLEEFGNNPKEAFKDLNANPIWLNKDAGIAIRSVRIIDNQEDLQPLHRDPLTGVKKDFAATRNNHHVAIYRLPDGSLEEDVVTFWDAFLRKKNGEDVIQRKPTDGRKFLFSMQVNEMFVFNLDPNQINITDPKNYPIVSKNLYRVQKLSTMAYCFRHQLATTINDDDDMIYIKSFGRLESLTPIKVKITNTNRVSIVND
jgi:CRISPR-associated endonuclease Csn1